MNSPPVIHVVGTNVVLEEVDLGDDSHDHDMIDLVYEPHQQGIITETTPVFHSAVPSGNENEKNATVALGMDREQNEILEQPQKIDEVVKTPPDSSQPLTTPAATPIPNKETPKKIKTKKTRKDCPFSTVVLIILLAIFAGFLSGYIGYWVTREKYEAQLAALRGMTGVRRNTTQIIVEEEPYEEEEPPVGPTVEELRLPDALEPVWYNGTLKMYLPGYVDLPEGKNFTTDGNIMIRLAVKKPTDEIVLNAKDLVFPTDVNKVKILTERPASRARRQTVIDSPEMKNSTEDGMANSTREKLKNTTGISGGIPNDEMEIVEDEPVESPVKRLMLVEGGPKVKKILYNSSLEKVFFTLDSPLEAGTSVVLQLPFSGRIPDNLTGIFFSSYKKVDGDSSLLAVMDCQPASARKLFPSFDEPSFVAPLTLTILHPNGTTARGNAMEITDAEPTSDPLWVKTSLDVARSLPTSSTGFTLTNFDKAQTTTDTGTKISVYARPEAINLTGYALDTSVKAFEFLQKYLAVPPRSTKLDVFALPELSKEAMCGDGLILVREDRLLYDPQVDSIETKVQVAQTICHEFTKQWFGNVMGDSDLKALWLNEAMAKYMEYICVENIFAGLDKNSLQTVDSMEQALLDDARSSSHPMSIEVVSPSGVTLMSDEITNDKGAALLRMLNAIIGEEKFQRGVQDFLKAHHDHSVNTEKENLFDAWNNVVLDLKSWDGEKLNVGDFIDKWIKQMGYPVVEIYRIDPHTVELTQRRFKLDHLTPEKAKYRNALYWYKWDVPIFYQLNGKPQDMVWLHEAIRLPLNVSDEILINPDSLGFYRVNYDDEGWAEIARQLELDHTKYSPSARARFISDALALAEAGMLPYETAFAVISYLPKETDYLPWSVAVTALDNFYNRLSDSDLEESANEFVLEKLTPIFKLIDLGSLNFDNGDDFLASTTRRRIAKLYCKLSPDVCNEKLTNQFKKNLLAQCDKNSSIASACSKVPSIGRSMVYCVGVAEGGDKDFKKIHELSRDEVNTGERTRLTEALACSKDPRKLRNLLYESIESEDGAVRKSNVQQLVTAMNDQLVGAEIITDFVLDNWKELTNRFAQDPGNLQAVLGNALDLNSEREIKQFERFLVDHKATTRDLDALKSQLETARNRQHWLKANRNTIKDLLSSNNNEKEL
ncbi:hypothetical protein V3C99_014011 [Haemonchus contortus]